MRNPSTDRSVRWTRVRPLSTAPRRVSVGRNSGRDVGGAQGRFPAGSLEETEVRLAAWPRSPGRVGGLQGGKRVGRAHLTFSWNLSEISQIRPSNAPL